MFTKVRSGPFRYPESPFRYSESPFRYPRKSVSVRSSPFRSVSVNRDTDVLPCLIYGLVSMNKIDVMPLGMLSKSYYLFTINVSNSL